MIRSINYGNEPCENANNGIHGLPYEQAEKIIEINF